MLRYQLQKGSSISVSPAISEAYEKHNPVID